MESSSNASEMQSWQDYIPRLTFAPRAGQRKAWDHAASGDPCDRLMVLPTGYGKTKAGLGYYGVRRERGLTNRLLWVVASDEQRKQLAPVPGRDGKRGPTASDQLRTGFGLDCLDTTRADGAHRELRMHWEGLAEIFVTTYQTVLYNATFFEQLLATGSWLVIADEAHHLSEDGKWAERLAAHLPSSVETLYMSATPVRTDHRPLRGVPTKDGAYFAEPEVLLRDAIDEGAVRQPLGHEEEWDLQFENRSGELVTVTTTELLDKKVRTEKDLDDFMVRQNLRWRTQKFLDKIYRDALARLDEKRARWPGRHQMIVFAMSNSHAKFLANEVIDDADWVGVQRSDAENEAVMNRYKAGELPVLVQVDKAGEGFDHPPASVALFLNMIQSDTKLMQQLGRVMRRDADIPAKQDYADVFADSAHPVIDVVRKLEPDDKEFRDGPGPGPGPGPGDWVPLPDLLDIEAQWRSTQLVTPNGMGHQHDPGVHLAAETFGLTPDQIIEITRMVHGIGEARQEVRPRHGDEVQNLEFYKDRVDRAMRKIVSGAIRLIGLNEAVPKGLDGQLKRRIHGRWKRDSRRSHDGMLASDFKAKYEWLQEIDRCIGERGKVPGWLHHGW